MQPRREPCTVKVTNAAPGRSSAAKAAGDWVPLPAAEPPADCRSGRPRFDPGGAARPMSFRRRAAPVAAAVTASRAIRRSAALVSGSSSTGAGWPLPEPGAGPAVESTTFSPRTDIGHLPRRPDARHRLCCRPVHKVAPFPCRPALVAIDPPAETRTDRSPTRAVHPPFAPFRRTRRDAVRVSPSRCPTAASAAGSVRTGAWSGRIDAASAASARTGTASW